jgi:hypothetical protein
MIYMINIQTFNDSESFRSECLFNPSRIDKSSMSELFEVRKVLTQGQDHLSHSVVIPHNFLAGMKIIKGDLLKIYTKGNVLLMEKLNSQEPKIDG